MLRSHFFGQNSEESVIFCLERMKLITLTATSIISIKCIGRVFDAQVCRYSEECEDVTRGHSFFTSVTNPDLTLIILGEPFAQLCLKLCQPSSLASKKASTRAFTSAKVVVADSVLLNKNSYFIFLSFSNWAKAIRWLSKL